MGIAADSLFNVLMSWVRALVNALWALFSADRTTALEFLGKNWMAIAAVIIVCGLVIDWIVWLIRWQPYHLWARRIRRLLRLDELEEEPKKPKGRAHAAVLPEKRYAPPAAERLYEEYEDDQEYAEDEETDYGFDGEIEWPETQEETPDGQQDKQEEWRRMQEEARMRAETERAERERLEQERREAERIRREREAYEAEQARLAREAYEAEQARLAQEEYARQMEEYERQKAQYERDLAEYERQKAEYEAQLAAQQAYEEEQRAVQHAGGAARRRRTAVTPEEAQYTQVIERPAKPRAKQTAAKTVKPASAKAKKPESGREKPVTKAQMGKAEKPEKSHALLNRVAKLIEPEEEELITRTTLPPRVDMNDAFRTAKLPVVTPPRSGRRKK